MTMTVSANRGAIARAGALAVVLAGCTPAQELPEPATPPRAESPVPEGPCVLSAREWSDRPPLSLAVRDHGQPAVEIYGAIRDAKLTLGPTSRLTVLAGPVPLAGYVEPSWVEVHVKEPVSLGPTFVVSPFRDLSRDIRHWPESASDSAQVSIEAPSGIELAHRGFAAIPCSALTMETRSFDTFAALGVTSKTKHAALKAGRRVALSESARGAVAAFVTLAGGPQPVDVLAEDGASSHVAFARGTLLVHGWVSTSELEPESAAAAVVPKGFVFTGTNADRFDAPTQKEERVCTHDVTLQVMEPRARAPQPLGRIPAGTRIGIVLWDHTLTSVFVPEAGIFPVGEGTLVVPTKELDGCK